MYYSLNKTLLNATPWYPRISRVEPQVLMLTVVLYIVAIVLRVLVGEAIAGTEDADLRAQYEVPAVESGLGGIFKASIIERCVSSRVMCRATFCAREL